MGRPKGTKKSGGRSKGVPNKKTIELKEFFESIDTCIPSEIMKILPSLDPKDKISVLLSLMTYIYPKRKPIIKIEADVKTLTMSDIARKLEVQGKIGNNVTNRLY